MKILEAKFSLFKLKFVMLSWLICVFTFIMVSSQSAAQTYTDVALQRGIEVEYSSTDMFGAGVSFYDFTNNGWDDLTFVMEDDSIIFYINNNGYFQKAPSFIYGPGEVNQVIWVDYNNNGHNDLFITVTKGEYKLYKNDGNFNFTDVTQEAGLEPVISHHTGASFADYNKSGFLDIYICNYAVIRGEDSIGHLNQLYRNNGDGTFTNVTLEAGVGDGLKYSFQGAWLDYNNNGWPDLFVINDRVLYSNSLYRNNGDGTFTNVTEESGTGLTENDPMTATVGDFNNNGLLDIYMTNTGTQVMPGMLLVNNGDGTFTEDAAAYGVDIQLFSWGASWVDFNNNTYQDLYVTTDRRHENNHLKNQFYENINGKYFETNPSIFLSNHYSQSFSVAKGDFTNNGYYDLVVNNTAPENAMLWKNSGGDNNYIKITLQGTQSNRSAIGSWIKVYAGGNQYSKYTKLGQDYLSQSSQHKIFGLADYDVVDSVVVEYSLGHIDVYYDLKVNKHYYFTEGETVKPEITGPAKLCEGDSVLLSIRNFNPNYVYEWNNGYQEQDLTIYNSGTYWVTGKSPSGFTVTSDTLSIEIAYNPKYFYDITHPSCHNSTDGKITLEIKQDPEAYQLSWNTGDTIHTLQELPEGTYHFTYSDQHGCIIRDSVELDAPYELSSLVNSFPETSSAKGKVFLFVYGGTPPYEAYLNDQPAEIINSEMDSGIYNLVIYDNNGCIYEHQFYVPYIPLTGIYEPFAGALMLYPNPLSRGNLLLRTNVIMKDAEINIYDLAGRRVFFEIIDIPKPGEYPVGFNPDKGGAYYVQIVSKGEQIGKILIVE